MNATPHTIAASNHKFGAWTPDGRRKSWFIIGMTLNAAAYCAGCADDNGISEANWENNEADPIFADQSGDGMACDICGKDI